MNIDYTVSEVGLSYKPKFKNIYKVVSSEDAYKYLLPTYKEGYNLLQGIFQGLIPQPSQPSFRLHTHIRGRNNRYKCRCKSYSTSCIAYQFSSHNSCT